MDILFVSQYYPPEVNAPANRVSELARAWVRAGHRVTVLTAFPNHPQGSKRPADRRVLSRREDDGGVEVLRAYIWATPNKGLVRRMFSYASFMVSALLVGSLRCRRPGLVIATSPQLLTAVAGWGLSLRFNTPFVFEVRDLWPESIVAVEAMRENRVVAGLKRLAALLYRRCDRIVTVGEGYKRKIVELYGIDPAKISVVENGVDTALFVPRTRDPDFERAAGWQGKKVLLYAGTHGMAHGLAVVLGAAELLKGEPSVLFALVGDGAEKQGLVEAARGLDNVRFYEQQPREALLRFYAACDIGLVHLRDTPLFQEVLPSKIFEYFGMERPILIGVGGEARALVEAARGGIWFRPDDPQALADGLRALLADPGLGAMGRRGRAWVLQHYDRTALAERYAALLQAIVDRAGAAAPAERAS